MHNFNIKIKYYPLISLTLLLGIFFITNSYSGSNNTFSSTVEVSIRSGLTSTAELIVSEHPRIWLLGDSGWDPSIYGSFMWRAFNTESTEFSYCACGAGTGGDYTADYMITEGQVGHTTHGRRVLEHIMASKALSNDWWDQMSRTCATTYSSDEYLAYARDKLFGIFDVTDYPRTIYTLVYGSVSYDWLYNEVYSNGTPVLSQADKENIRNELFTMADRVKGYAAGSGNFFYAGDMSSYLYPMVGLAVYESSGQGISAEDNAKAMSYLDDFDTYVVGEILPAINKQGGDGGWHGGMTSVYPYESISRSDDMTMVPALLAPMLYAHYTATGQLFEESVFSTGFLKYFVEFQNYMIRPDEGGYYPSDYYAINTFSTLRHIWTFLYRTYSRRRFSTDPEQRKIAELGGWIQNTYSAQFHHGGSWDMLQQVLWEEKWPNPRTPEELGYGTKHFRQLGWIFMREGFGSSDDLAALFMSQRYHWSHLNPYSQNSFTLEKKGELIEGFQNSIYLDDEYQRTVASFPTVADGADAYSPGSAWDVGPGITNFQSNDLYDYMKGDASNAYDPSKLDQFTRELVYIKPNIFVMFDKVVTDNADTKKSWIIDPGSSPLDEGDNLYTIENGAGKLWIKNLSPQSTTVETMSASQFKISSSGAMETYFLHVMEASDSGVSSSLVLVDDAELVTQSEWMGVNMGSYEILFNTEGDSAARVKGAVTPIEGDEYIDIPDQINLQQNYPNPFNPSTQIYYNLSYNAFVNIYIFDVSGRFIKKLVQKKQSAGHHTVIWDATDQAGRQVASGLYIYQLQVGDCILAKKMLLLR